MERGGRDDITVAVIDVDPSGGQRLDPLRRRDLPERVPAGRRDRGQRGRHRDRPAAPAPAPRAGAPPRSSSSTVGLDGLPVDQAQGGAQATGAAIDALRDGTLFAVIAGTDGPRGLPAHAAARRRPPPRRAQAAKAASRQLTAGRRHRDRALAARSPPAVRGDARRRCITRSCSPTARTSTRPRRSSQAALRPCEGRFQCDCRGVGTDWEVAELRRIASALLGSVDIVAEPAEMAADFRAIMERAMARGAGDVALRLWTPQGAEVASSSRSRRRSRTSRRARRSTPSPPTTPPARGAARRATTTSAIVVARTARLGDGDAGRAASASSSTARSVSQALIRAVWTDDEALSTRISREVAHYTGQAELAEAIQDGWRRARPATRRARRSGSGAPSSSPPRAAARRSSSCSQRRRRRGRRDGDGPPQARGGRRRRDDARHPLDQDAARDARRVTVSDEPSTHASEVTKPGAGARRRVPCARRPGRRATASARPAATTSRRSWRRSRRGSS